MRIIKVEKGKYLYNTKYDTLRIDKVNQAYPNLWWVYSENTNQTCGAIKDWEDKMKGRKDIEFLRIERKEKLPNGNLMIYYKYNTLNEFDTTKVGTDVIKNY